MLPTRCASRVHVAHSAPGASRPVYHQVPKAPAKVVAPSIPQRLFSEKSPFSGKPHDPIPPCRSCPEGYSKKEAYLIKGSTKGDPCPCDREKLAEQAKEVIATALKVSGKAARIVTADNLQSDEDVLQFYADLQKTYPFLNLPRTLKEHSAAVNKISSNGC